MAIKKRKHPKFLRPNYGRTSRSRIKIAWRRPRGIDNKKRQKIAYMGASPSIGYGQPAKIKYFHPAGMRETLVQSPSEIAGLKDILIRIAGSVGRKKRVLIEKAAKDAGLRVLNPMHERKSDKARKVAKAAKLAAAAKKPEKREEPKKEEKKADAAKPTSTAAAVGEQASHSSSQAATAAPASTPATAPAAEEKKQ